jgi:hypothetical protein
LKEEVPTEAIEALTQCFSSKKGSDLLESQEQIENLEKKIGQLTMDNDFLKKNYVKYYRK